MKEKYKNAKPRRFNDLTGKRFGLLVATKISHRKKVHRPDRPNSMSSRIYWECLCDCGNTVTMRSNKLTCGRRVSCGCLGKVFINDIRFDSFLEASVYLDFLDRGVELQVHKRYPGLRKVSDFYLSESNTYVEVSSFSRDYHRWDDYFKGIDDKKQHSESIGANFEFINRPLNNEDVERLSEAGIYRA